MKDGMSQTAHAIEAMQTYGRRPYEDEIDHRPMPEEGTTIAAISDIFDALASTLEGTSMEPDLEDLLWHQVNIFHRAVERVSVDLDRNEVAQRDAQQHQDGSEIAAVELERLIAEGSTHLNRLHWFESVRDRATDLFSLHTGSDWRPRAGSMVNRRHLTAAMLDSRDFIAARRQAEKAVHLPTGPRIFVAGGLDVQDVDKVWGILDKIRSKHPDMVLLHCGGDKGAEKIAALWARNRKVTEISFKPDWRQGRAAPFKRNDQLLDTMPIGGVVFPGTGIIDNLADKARTMGIPLWDFRGVS